MPRSVSDGAARFWSPAIFWIGLACIVVLIAMDQFTAVVALTGLVVVSWAALTFPLFAFVTGLALYAIPLSLQSTGAVSPDIGVIYAGVRPLDVVLAGMVGAVIVRLLVDGASIPRSARPVLIGWSLLWTLLILEIVRNLGVYGVSAPGEFRSRFMVLIVPAFVGLCLKSSAQRRRAMWALFIISVPAVLLAIPAIGNAKGWGIGPSSRFLPAATALGMLYGVTWMFLCRKQNVVRFPPGLEIVLSIPCVALLFVDSHRSVWLAAIAVLLVLMAVGELKLSRSWGWLLVGVLALSAVVMVVGVVTGVSPIEYISTRILAVTDPLQDQTAAWRFYVWRAQIASIKAHPIVGQGFGGYFDAYIPELGQRTDIFPHSLYVLSAVKIGLLGLSAIIYTGVTAYRVLARRIRAGVGSDFDRVALVMAAVAVVSLAVYGIAYAWDFFSLAWMGIGLSVCFWTTADPASGVSNTHESDT